MFREMERWDTGLNGSEMGAVSSQRFALAKQPALAQESALAGKMHFMCIDKPLPESLT